MSNYKKHLIVEPGAKIKLRDFNPSRHGKHESHKAALPKIQENVAAMAQLQFLMFSENKHSLLVVLQGLDTAGKDGVIRHVFGGINPQGCRITGFKQPTAQELSHDFLWRVHPHVPSKGGIAVFNRSHYEDVLVTRVHKLASEKHWSKRFDQINEFERLLVEENNTTIVKFFLHISKEEQLERFKQRLDDPVRNWKISESDYKERDYWDAYMKAYEDLLQKTSTKHSPWFIIPSDHKWFRDLAISQILKETFEGLDMKQPLPNVDLKDIARRYHQAEEKAKARGRKTAA
jgi:PPK2 family polyphosphate:nucleotide phosphotransferase